MIQIPEGYKYNKERGYYDTRDADVYRSQPSAGKYFTKAGWVYYEKDGVMWHCNKWYAEADVEHIDVLTCWAIKKWLAGATLLCYMDWDTIKMLRTGAADNILIDGGYFDGQHLKHGLRLMKAGCKVGLWRKANGELMILAERDRSKDRYAAILVSSARATKYFEDTAMCTLELDLQELCETAAKASKAITVKNKAREKCVKSKELFVLLRDRIHEEARGNWHYNAKQFYYSIKDLVRHGCVLMAMDYSAEEDVKEALCECVMLGKWSLELCKYINDRVWLHDIDCKHGKGHMEGGKFVLNKEVQPVASKVVAVQPVKTDATGKVAGLGWVMWTDASEQARQDKRARDIAKAKMAVKRARMASRASGKATVKRVAVKEVDARKAKKQGIFKVWLGKLRNVLGKVAML